MLNIHVFYARVDFSNNCLTEIPPSLAKCPDLSELKVSCIGCILTFWHIVIWFLGLALDGFPIYHFLVYFLV